MRSGRGTNILRNTFRGGVHPLGFKELSREKPLVAFEPKGEMVFPLQQHIGKSAKAIVKKGDAVLVGQRIAEADGFVSAHIYSSCSGTVKAIEKRRTLSGDMLESIVINNDGQFTLSEGVGTEDRNPVTEADIIARVKDAGIVGLGGAGFPTYVKLQPKDPSAIHWVIANGAECEPYLTCNDQLMRSEADAIVKGLELTLFLFKNAHGVIAIEDNKPEAIAAMRRAASGKERISVAVMATKYPQGGERSLIQAIAGVDFPLSQLPADVGCIVDNVGTLYAIERAVHWHEPLYRHGLTLSGDAVANPGNYIVRDGTSFAELVEASGGLKPGVTLKKALAGGPMMGITLPTLDVPIQKMNNGLTLMTEDINELSEKERTACLHCGRCNAVCPVGLVPQHMADAAETGNWERYEKKLYGLECIQCGSCTFICPARRPLMQLFKQTKAEILAKKRREAAESK